MSHDGRINIPVVIRHVVLPGKLQPVSLADYLSDSDSAKQRFIWRSLDGNETSDPWQLRKEFLSWPLEHWEGFIEMAGYLGAHFVSKNDFGQWQELVKQALLRPPKDWHSLESEGFPVSKVRELLKPLPVTFDWEAKIPVARICTRSTLTAMVATIQLDRLRGVSFRLCARTDCDRVFPIENHRNKIFCCYECAHLVAVRNSRNPKKRRKARRRQVP